MNSVVYKYRVALAGPTFLEIPAGATILTPVQVQDRPPFQTVVLWAIVDPEQPLMPVELYTARTGEDVSGVTAMQERPEHYGTFQLDSGYVGHVFRVSTV